MTKMNQLLNIMHSVPLARDVWVSFWQNFPHPGLQRTNDISQIFDKPKLLLKFTFTIDVYTTCITMFNL